jgi:hypothetical protein
MARIFDSSCPAGTQVWADCVNLSALPGIPVFLFGSAKTWMAGTSPAMTSPFVRPARHVGQDTARSNDSVMPALGAGIHVLLASSMRKDVDGRDKSGHDGGWARIITGLRRTRIRF